MYKVVLTHLVAPGKQRAMEAWFKEADQKRAKVDPSYIVPKRYMTVFGSQSKVVCEFNVADIAALAEILEPKVPIASGTGSFLEFVVPGMSEMVLLKEIELK
jgi:hypothetical protein